MVDVMRRLLQIVVSIVGLLCGSILLLTGMAGAATTGEKYPTLGETVSESPWSDNIWSSPDNIYADDAATAYVISPQFDDPDQTYVLKATGFDFSSIPSAATIDGVICRVNSWYRLGQGSGSMDLMQLLNTSKVRVGTNQCATPVALTIVVTTVIEKGGSTDKWGNDLTASWVKNSNFGVGLGILATANNADVDVDYVTLEIYYTEGLNQTSWHVDSTVNSFAIRDSVDAPGSCDKVVLLISQTNDIATSTRVDSFTSDCVDTVEAVHLEDSVEYYFWCEATDGVTKDTTAVDSITTPNSLRHFVRDADSCATCSDDSSGTTALTAWVSMEKAISDVEGGDTVFIGAGDYDEIDTLDEGWSDFVYFVGDLDGDTCGEVGWPEIGRLHAYTFDPDQVSFKNVYFNTYGEDVSGYPNSSFTGGNGTGDNERFVLNGCRFAGAVVFTEFQYVEIVNSYFEDDAAMSGQRGFYGVVQFCGTSDDSAFFDNNVIEWNNNAYTGIEFAVYVRCSGTNFWMRNNIFSTSSATEAQEGFIGYQDMTPKEIDYTFYDDDSVSNDNFNCRKISATWYCVDDLTEWRDSCDCDDSAYVEEATDQLDVDGYHLVDGADSCRERGKDVSGAINAYPGNSSDIDSDSRPQNDRFDIGCDERFVSTADTIKLVIAKVDSGAGSFAVECSVSTNISPPSDSMILWVSWFDDLSTALQKDSVQNDDSAVLLITGLQDNALYYFWVVAWATDSSDTVQDLVNTSAGATVLNSVTLRPGLDVTTFGSDWTDQDGGSSEYTEIDEETLDTTDYWRGWIDGDVDAFNVDSLLTTAYPESVTYHLVTHVTKGDKGMVVVGRSEYENPEYLNYPADTLWVDSSGWDTLTVGMHLNPADDSVFQQKDFFAQAQYGWYVEVYRTPDPAEDDSIGQADDDSTAQLATDMWYGFRVDTGFDGWLDSLAFEFQDANGVADCKMALYSNVDDGGTMKPRNLLDSTAEFDASTGWAKVALVNGYEGEAAPGGENYYWLILRPSAADSIRADSAWVSLSWESCSGTLAYASQWPLTDLYTIGTPAEITHTKGVCWATGYPIPYIRVASSWIEVQYYPSGVGNIVKDVDNQNVLGGGIVQ